VLHGFLIREPDIGQRFHSHGDDESQKRYADPKQAIVHRDATERQQVVLDPTKNGSGRASEA
jgi:hypothetical protein